MQIKLAKLLFLVMIVTGIIMPIHAYSHEMSETRESHSVELESQHNQDNESVFCDHCCHFSSHTQGMIRIYTKSGISQKNYVINFQNKRYTSVESTPPYHPPIA